MTANAERMVYIVMQQSKGHYMSYFPVAVFSSEEDAEYAVEGTLSRGEQAYMEEVVIDFPREKMFKEWDEKRARGEI